MSTINFIGQTAKTLGNISLSSASVINCETIILPFEGAKSKTAINGTLGAEVHSTIGGNLGVGRGTWLSSRGPAPAYESRMYAVYGRYVYRYSADLLTAYKIGEIANNGEAVSMTDNGFVFVICDGQNIFTYPLETLDGQGQLKAVTLPVRAGEETQSIVPTTVGFIKQRIVTNDSTTNQWFYSDLPTSDPKTTLVFQDDSFYSAETNGDNISALKVATSSIYIFGPRSFEIRRGQDNQDSPFALVDGSQSAIGCSAVGSIATIDDKIFWLASSDIGTGGIYMCQSATVTRISDIAIEGIIADTSDIDKAVGYCYAYKGNVYYVISFNSGNTTLVYNVSNGLWHQRSTRDLPNAVWKAWAYSYLCVVNNEIYGQLLFGSNEGVLVKLADDIYTEWTNDPIVREFITQPIWQDLDKIQLREVVLDMQVGGTDLLTGYGSDPKLLMQISKDGGETFGPIKEASLGKQGEYTKKVRYFVKGDMLSLVLKFMCSAPINFSIYQGRIDFMKCRRT